MKSKLCNVTDLSALYQVGFSHYLCHFICLQFGSARFVCHLLVGILFGSIARSQDCSSQKRNMFFPKKGKCFSQIRSLFVPKTEHVFPKNGFCLARARCLSARLRYLRLTRLPRHNRGPVPGGNRSAACCLCTVLRRALYHYATRSPKCFSQKRSLFVRKRKTEHVFPKNEACFSQKGKCFSPKSVTYFPKIGMDFPKSVADFSKVGDGFLQNQ